MSAIPSHSPRASHPDPAPDVLLRTVLKSPTHSRHNRELAQHIIWDWVNSKWSRLVPSLAEREKDEFQVALPGRRLSMARSAGGAAWMLEVAYSERDSVRTWTTTALVADTGEADLLAVQTTCSDLPSARAVAPPRLIANCVQRLAFEDAGLAVQGEPRTVEEDEELEGFCGHLLNQQRELPVIALANKPGSRYYGVDPRGLAEAVRGLAHVACLTPEAAAELRNRLGQRFAPMPGAVRIYAPGFTPDSEARDHPLLRKAAPAGPAEGEEAVEDPNAFRRLVSRRVYALTAGLHGGAGFFEGLMPAALA